MLDVLAIALNHYSDDQKITDSDNKVRLLEDMGRALGKKGAELRDTSAWYEHERLNVQIALIENAVRESFREFFDHPNPSEARKEAMKDLSETCIMATHIIPLGQAQIYYEQTHSVQTQALLEDAGQ